MSKDASPFPERAWTMRVILSGVALLTLILLTAGCNGNGSEKPALKPPEVLVTEAVRDYVTDYEEFTGRTESKHMVAVKARVQGYLDKINFKDGDIVKEGQVLFEIDPRLYEAEYDRAKAALAQNKKRLARLERDFERAKSLLKKGGIGQEEYDKVEADTAEAKEAVGVAEAERKKAKQNFDFTKVIVPALDPSGVPNKANPRTGRVGRRMVDPGNLVKADDTLLT